MTSEYVTRLKIFTTKFLGLFNTRKPEHPIREALAPTSYDVALSELREEVELEKLELEELDREISELKNIHIKLLTNVQLSDEEAKKARLLKME